MNLFSISELEQYSGIKAHTIRIWEQRYEALKPQRTEGNTRFYDADQLRRLLNIVSLLEAKYKVKEVCSMTDKELALMLERKTREVNSDNDYASHYVKQLIAASLTFDEILFEKAFAGSMLRFGIKTTYEKVLYPALVRMGQMWTRNTIMPTQEHFISNLVRQKLFSAIDALPVPDKSDQKWLLFLPEDEFHDLGLLFAHYIIRKAGRKVIYLGGNVPLRNLKEVAHETHATHALFFFVHKTDVEIAKRYLIDLRKAIKPAKIFAACNQQVSDSLPKSKDVVTLQSVEDLEEVL